MNPAAHPAVVAAEVAYRFERDRITTTPVPSVRRRHHALGRWLRRRVLRGSGIRRRSVRTHRA